MRGGESFLPSARLTGIERKRNDHESTHPAGTSRQVRRPGHGRPFPIRLLPPRRTRISRRRPIRARYCCAKRRWRPSIPRSPLAKPSAIRRSCCRSNPLPRPFYRRLCLQLLELGVRQPPRLSLRPCRRTPAGHGDQPAHRRKNDSRRHAGAIRPRGTNRRRPDCPDTHPRHRLESPHRLPTGAHFSGITARKAAVKVFGTF